uniref:Putative secreted peptide n=1 Tax=Anopheles braziliensis TaxID=58242 RepID=A0A2M3ZSQ6_9DIPT
MQTMKQRWATSAFAFAIGSGGGSGTLQNAASRSLAPLLKGSSAAPPMALAATPPIPPPILPTVSCPNRMINRSPGGYSSPWILSRAYIADCPLLYTTVAVTLRLLKSLLIWQ